MSYLMAGNGKGWEKVAECNDGQNVGQAATGVGVSTSIGYMTFEVGTRVDCYTRADKRAMNKGFNADREWTAHTALNARKHSGGAVVNIDRNFTDDNGKRVVASYYRSH